ncbi:MAG: FAD-dependent thymidylate synthase [Deltaproteobacteria bacterium]|nr:FAD-dependent thymidylate synthase [Deltaproteobacteria bacterium]
MSQDLPTAEPQTTTLADDASVRRCLDHGFVRLVDVMGDDHSIVQAARVSYGTGTKTVRADRGLIRYLMQHQHTTPFEMVEFKFHCRMPIFVARQWIRHRTANVNEISGRYSIMEDVFWEPRADDLRTQSTTNRQGSTDTPIDTEHAAAIAAQFRDDQRHLYRSYQTALDAGVAREIARVNLPLSLYTEWYWKIDLHNLLHFLQLRLDAHAQREIRVFAEAMAEFVRTRCPLTWEAFEEFRLHAAALSHSERHLVSTLLQERELLGELLRRREAQLQADGASERLIERELADLREKLTPSASSTR